MGELVSAVLCRSWGIRRLLGPGFEASDGTLSRCRGEWPQARVGGVLEGMTGPAVKASFNTAQDVTHHSLSPSPVNVDRMK